MSTPSASTRAHDLRARLEGLGDPGGDGWIEGRPNYVAELGLSLDDVPVLLEVARQWAERESWPADESDTTIYSSIHAWRALGQLRAAGAVDGLVGIIGPLAQLTDDWSFEELPRVFVMIGPAAAASLGAHLIDRTQPDFSRVLAAGALAGIAREHPDERGGAVAMLTAALGQRGQDRSMLNGFLVSYLIDLHAAEAALVIEQAFADDCVDSSVCGDWNRVRRDLGVEGSGLGPSRPAQPSASGSLKPPGRSYKRRKRKSR